MNLISTVQRSDYLLSKDLPALIEPNGIQYRWLGCNLLFSTPIHFNKIFVFIYNNNNNDEDVIVDRGVSLDVDIFGDNLEELSVSIAFRSVHNHRISAHSDSTTYGSIKSDSMNVDTVFFFYFSLTEHPSASPYEYDCISNDGNNASAAARNICAALGEGAVADRTCRDWLKRFRKGDMSLEDRPRSGRPLESDIE
ncbi:unnamed protein product [Rotaria sp. Silwood1]|nr:unnamed protein product [Rotaria sp. Silwood1]